MRGAVLLALVFSVCVWPDVLPSPQELHKAMLASYKDLGSFFAEVEETFAVDTYITFTPMQVWFSVPFIRIERKAEDSAMELPPLEIHDTARRKSWYLLFKARVWEEEEVLEFGQPLSLWALGLDYLREFQPETAFKERKNGETVYVLKGRLGKMEITVWLDPKTLFILQVIRRGGSLTWIHIIKNFQPGVEIAHELFQPPSLHEIARIYKLSPEGMEIAQKVGDRYRALQSFFMRKRILVEREVVNEEWIYWRPPFLRIELRTPPSPWFSPEVILVGLLDLQEGATYKYFAREDRWERYDLDLEEELGAEFALFAAARFFSGQPIVEVTEEILGQKRVWRLTGRGTPGTEAPPSQWWIDQETFQIVQYAEAYPMVQRPTDQLQWGVRTVQIVQFEENGKYLRSSSPNPRRSPPPHRKPFLPLEPSTGVPAEKLRPGEAVLEWPPFSWEKLGEALQDAGVVVLYFSADWCTPCRILEEEAFRAPAIIALLEPLPRFKVDLTNSVGLGLFYKVRGLPTFLFLGPEGKEIGRITGYSSTALLYAEIQRILAEVKP